MLVLKGLPSYYLVWGKEAWQNSSLESMHVYL